MRWHQLSVSANQYYLHAKLKKQRAIDKVYDSQLYLLCRYVNRVTIMDIKAGQQWHFICNSWLAIDIGENILDKVFHAASDVEMKLFQNLFFMKIAESLTDQHIWFSVVERPSRSPFTRVQRVSCCFSLLLGSMLTNIMFWGTSPNESLQYTTLGTSDIYNINMHIIYDLIQS
ncbi:polycystic kidney disease protein 1-like 2 [Leucoraja erinacea]|uniref:polycystic kidney disease protein 1-like 2 n=1 Tax=Leucoraja erinaceus TaxID=7782 RepID=UPI0024545E66|nr:polycystic kidney disease protein 1-like 2 [Leucoraja erinacea]